MWHFLRVKYYFIFNKSCLADTVELTNSEMNEKVQMITIGKGWGSIQLETTIFSPKGTGPFPLVVMNHGTELGDPKDAMRERFEVASREFLKRGYIVVIPMRPGFSKSTGRQPNYYCDTESYGMQQAESIRDFLIELIKKPEIDPKKIILLGQSTGGLASIAFGTKTFPGVLGIINFAGGVRNNNCDWQKSLIKASDSYGRNTRIESLWFYGDNDSLWGKDLPNTMYQAFVSAGGKAKFVSFGKFAQGDAHGMLRTPEGTAIWVPDMERFLVGLGLPVEIKYNIIKTPPPPKTNYANIDDVKAVPILDDRRREKYKEFLTLPVPRAFVIAPHGNVGWSSGGFDPLASALIGCERFAKEPCTPYAVDEDVVWPTDKTKKIILMIYLG